MEPITRKFLKLLTSLFLVITSFYAIPEVKASETSTVTNADGVNLTKTATRTHDKLNEWRIDLKLDFAPKIKKQDIVLVIDTSGSMNNNSRLVNAKTAAKLFTDILLDNSRPHENRIALVSYNTGVYQTRNFTNNSTQLKTSIDNLSANGGTFTQAGVKMARDMLSGSTADNKIIVLLSDGVPTFGYGLTSAGLTKFNTGDFTQIQTGGSYSEYNVTYNSGSGNYVTSNGVSYSSSKSTDLRVYQPSNNREAAFVASDFNYALNSNSDMGGHGNQARKFAHEINDRSIRVLNLFKTAIAEASIAKNAGNALYTIALDLAGNTDAEDTLKAMATSTSHYFTASSSNLSDHFEDIAQQLAFPFTDMSIVDPMGTGFSYVAGSATAHLGLLAGLTGSVNAINWNMTDQSFVYNNTTQRYEMHISYLVVTNTDMIPLVENNPGGFFDTNGDTKFIYRFNGAQKDSLFPKPKARPTIVKIIKELQDEAGQVITFNDTELPRVFNYTLQDLGVNYTGGISQSNTTEYHILQPIVGKTITETSVTNDDLNRYIRSTQLIKENEGPTNLADGYFILDTESGLNTLKLVNKLSANYVPQFDVTKSVVDANSDGFAEAKESLSYTVVINNTSGAFIRELYIKDTLSQISNYIDMTETNIIISRNGTPVLNNLEISDLISGFTTFLGMSDTLVLTFDVVVKEGMTLPSTLNNTVIVSHKDANASIPTGQSSISATKAVVDASGDGIAEAGENLDYTIVISNTGNVKKTNLFVQDTLSGLLPYVDAINATLLSVNGTNRPLQDLVDGFTLDVAANTTLTLTFRLKVKDNFDADTIDTLENIATVGTLHPEAEIPTGKPVLLATKSVVDASGDGIAEAGENLTYTIGVSNTGTVKKSNLWIQDTLSDLLPHIDDIATTRLLINGVERPLQNLVDGFYIDVDPGTTLALIFTVSVKDNFDASTKPTLRNIATVGNDEPDTEIPTGKPNLSATKTVVDASGDGIAEASEALTYTITISNTGNVKMKDVLIQDTLTNLLPHINAITTTQLSVNGVMRPLTDLVDGFMRDINANETVNLIFTVVVKDNFDADTVTNIRNVATVNDLKPDAEIPTGKPVITATKSVEDASGDGVAEAGENLTYTITVSNTGNVKKTNLWIQDTLSDLLAHVDDTSLLKVNIDGLERPLQDLIDGFMVTLVPNQVMTIKFTLKVKADFDADNVEILRNLATVGDETPETEIPTGKPVVTATKAVLDANGDGYAEAGEALTYTITITNSGDVKKSDLPVQDTLSDLLPYIDDITSVMLSVDGVDRPLSDLVAGFDIDIDADETITMTFTVKVKSNFDADDVDVLRNLATVGDETPETEIPTGKPVITATKAVADASGDGIAEAGETLYYAITIKNTGTVKKTNVFIQDTLSDLLPHIKDISTSSVAVNFVDRPLMDLVHGFTLDVNANQTILLTFAVTVKDDFDSSLVTILHNIATVDDKDPETEIPTGKPVITATKDVTDWNEDGYAEAGESLTYTITITNSGDVKKSDLPVQDTLSDLLPYIDDITSVMLSVDGVDRPLSDLVTGFDVDIDADETITMTFTVRVKEDFDADNVEILRNLATVGDETPETEIPTGKPVITATKAVLDANGDGYAEAGEALTYTITITNSGDVKKSDLPVQDTLSDLLPYIDDITSVMLSVDGVERPLSDLVAGIDIDIDANETITMTFTVKVKADFDADDVDVLRNLATVGDETPETEIPTGKPVITATKAVADASGDGIAEAGETLYYAITIKNTGTVKKTNVFVQDTLSDLLPHIKDISTSSVAVNFVDRPLMDLVNGFTLDVNADQTILLTFAVTVKDDFDSSLITILHNIATVDDKDPETEIPTGKPVITATKDVTDWNEDGYAEAGESLTYTITITNSGDVKKLDLPVQDTLADLLPYIDDITSVMLSVDGVDRPLSDLVTGFDVDIDADETITMTFTVRVKEDFNADDVDVLRNLVTVGDETPETEIPTGKPVITATKDVTDWNEDGYAEAGESLTYTITITNSGDVKKSDLPVQDTLADLLPYIDDITSVMLSVDGVDRPLSDLVTGFDVDIDADETITMTFTVKVKADFDADDVDVLRNLVTVGDETPETEIPTGKAIIAAVKEMNDENGDGYAEAGERLAYTITITNSGDVKKLDLPVQDTLGDLLPYIKDIGGIELSINGVKRPLQDLVDGFDLDVDAGESIVITFMVVVRDDFDADDIDVLRNIATVGDETPETEIPTGKPVIGATKDVTDWNEDGYAEAGESLTFTITITNSGEVKKLDLPVQDTLADLMPYIDDITSVMLSVDGVDRPLSDLVAGFDVDIDADETITMTFTVRVKVDFDADDVDVLRNLATVGDETPETEIPTGKAIITATKDVVDENQNGFAELDEVLTYTLTITNSGDVRKVDLFVQDTLSDLLPYINDISTTMVSVDGVDRPLLDLVDGFTLDVDVDTSITLIFSVIVKDDLDLDTIAMLHNMAVIGDETPEVEIPTGRTIILADKVVVDENENDIAEVEETLTYTISITNAGEVMMEALFVQDTLSELLPYIEDPTGLSVWVDGVERPLLDLMNGFYLDLGAGDTVELQFTVVVLDALEDVDLLVNHAHVGGLIVSAEIEVLIPEALGEIIPKDPTPPAGLPKTGVGNESTRVSWMLIMTGMIYLVLAFRRKEDE